MLIKLSENSKNQLMTFLKLAGKQQTRFIMHIISDHEINFIISSIGDYSILHLYLSQDQIEIKNAEPVFFEHPFELDIKDVSNILSYSKNKDVTISPEIINNDVEGMNVTIIDPKTNNLEKEIEIPCFIKEQNNRIPKLAFEKFVRLHIPIQTLSEIFNEIKEYNHQIIQLELIEKETKKFMVFSAVDSLNVRKKITLMRPIGEDFILERADLCKCKFTLDYVQRCISSAQASCYDTLRVTFATNTPMIIEYLKELKEGEEQTINNIENLMCYIAPAIEQEQSE